MRHRMKKEMKIGDFLTITRGASPRPISKYVTSDKNGINWIKIGDVDPNSFYITKTEEKITEEGAKKSRYVKEGDFILSNSMSFGRPYILKIDGCVHDGWLILSDYDKTVIPSYLYYLLRSPVVQSQFNGSANGSTVRNLNSDIVRNVIVNIHTDKNEQRSISKQLDTIQKAIETKAAQLSLLYEAVKSEFVEMFGDIIEHSQKIKLDEVCDFVTVGIANSATHAFCEDGVIMFRNQNIKEDFLDDTDVIHIKKDFAEKYKNKALKENDLLVVRTGYPGICCLVPKKYEGCQTFTTLIARLKEMDSINPKYICHYINSKFGRDYVNKNQAGVAQQNFGATALSKMPIVIPSIELQNQFVAFVKQIDKSKFIL